MGITSLVFTPDGRHVAFAVQNNNSYGRHEGFAVYDESYICIYNIGTQTLIHTLKDHTASILSMAVTSEGQHLVSASFDHTAKVWLLTSGAAVQTLPHNGYVCGVALSPDDQLIVTSTQCPDSSVYVWRMVDGNLLCQMKGHSDSVNSVAVSPDSLHVVSGANDKMVRVWLLTDGTLQRAIKHPRSVLSVAVTPDSQHVLTGCYDGNVRLIILATGALVYEFSGHTMLVYKVAVLASGRHVVSTSEDNTLCVWSLDFPSTKPLVLKRHAGDYDVAFHPNGKQVASATADKTVRIWTICKWSDRNHQLFATEFKALVFHLMCIKARLDNMNEQKINVCLPRLPMAVWLQVFAFLQLAF